MSQESNVFKKLSREMNMTPVYLENCSVHGSLLRDLPGCGRQQPRVTLHHYKKKERGDKGKKACYKHTVTKIIFPSL